MKRGMKGILKFYGMNRKILAKVADTLGKIQINF